MANKHYKEVQILADNELVEKLAETQPDLIKQYQATSLLKRSEKRRKISLGLIQRSEAEK